MTWSSSAAAPLLGWRLLTLPAPLMPALTFGPARLFYAGGLFRFDAALAPTMLLAACLVFEPGTLL